MPSSDPVPFAFAVDPDSGLVYAQMWGVVTGCQIYDLVAAVHAHPDWSCGFDAIWDCSNVDAHVVAPDEVKPIVAEEAASGTGRDAIVESRHLGDTGISRMLALYCRRVGKEMTVHHTLREALEALGRTALPPPLMVVGAH